MTLNFGQDLFPAKNNISATYDVIDLARGRAFIKFFATRALPKATIYESVTTGDDSDSGQSNAADWIAQTFTVGTTGTDEDFWINGIEVKVKSTTTSGSEDHICEIHAVDGSAKPDGTPIAFGRLKDFQGWGDTGQDWTRFTFQDFVKLSAATQYALVIYRSGSTNSTDLRVDSSQSYAGGKLWESANSGVDWVEDVGAAIMFRILGDTVNPLTFFTSDLGIDSQALYLGTNSADATYVQVFNTDLDITVGESSIIQGQAFIKLPLTSTSIVKDWLNFYFEVELLRDRGGTTTSMGTANTEAKDYKADGTMTLSAQINIENNIKFKPTDILRLNVKLKHKTESINAVTQPITMKWEDVTMTIPFKLSMDID